MNQKLGKAKRQRLATAKEECVCRSGRLAGNCCFKTGYWHRSAATLQLREPQTNKIVENCYLADFKSCDGRISAEHLVSESVMRVLAGDGKFTVGGTPWLSKGEFKEVGFGALTAKCLCEKHNSALHHLDDAAQEFFTSLRACYENDTEHQRAIVSGHDLERWLLKTLKAMAVSGNLAKDNAKLSGAFGSGIDIPTLLEQPNAWEPGTGLYCVMATGDVMVNHNRFQLSPLMNDADEIQGQWANILGISFVLTLKPMDLRPFGAAPVYRPGGINVAFPTNNNTVLLSWDDGLKHNALGLNFQKRVSAG